MSLLGRGDVVAVLLRRLFHFPTYNWTDIHTSWGSAFRGPIHWSSQGIWRSLEDSGMNADLRIQMCSIKLLSALPSTLEVWAATSGCRKPPQNAITKRHQETMSWLPFVSRGSLGGSIPKWNLNKSLEMNTFFTVACLFFPGCTLSPRIILNFSLVEQKSFVWPSFEASKQSTNRLPLLLHCSVVTQNPPTLRRRLFGPTTTKRRLTPSAVGRGDDFLQRSLTTFGREKPTNLRVQLQNGKLVGGFSPTHLKNMLVKFDHFPR